MNTENEIYDFKQFIFPRWILPLIWIFLIGVYFNFVYQDVKELNFINFGLIIFFISGYILESLYLKKYNKISIFFTLILVVLIR